MLYLFLLAHLVADFLLQPYWLVQRKRYWDGLLIHGGLVLGCMLLLGALDHTAWSLWPAMLLISVIHVGADWWKVQRADRWLRPAIVPFLLDQVIHVSTLVLVLGWALPAAQVWSFAASPAALPALYIAAYIVAACATPIGVMVWLDPTFHQVALAGAARRRSLLFGASVLTLALVGGPLALPVGLVGLALVLQWHPSPHPLDAPTGQVAVLGIAAVMGGLLTLMPLG